MVLVVIIMNVVIIRRKLALQQLAGVLLLKSRWCLVLFNYCYYGWPANGGTCDFVSCGTAAEADSVKCEINPTLPGCAPLVTDSVYVCENETYLENGQIVTQMGYFSLS